ncbi:Uncharacterised protein [Vibrio cholerae]|nr:Uncharacterised protein [Vibrio cholerae]
MLLLTNHIGYETRGVAVWTNTTHGRLCAFGLRS